MVSYEPMIESVRAKADDLATNSPISKPTTDTSQILNKYQIIKDQAMVRFNKYILNTCLWSGIWIIEKKSYQKVMFFLLYLIAM